MKTYQRLVRIFVFILLGIGARAQASGGAAPKKANYDFNRLVGRYTVKDCLTDYGTHSQGSLIEITQTSATQLQIKSDPASHIYNQDFSYINEGVKARTWDNGWSHFKESIETFTTSSGIFKHRHQRESPNSVFFGFPRTEDSRTRLEEVPEANGFHFRTDWKSQGSGWTDCTLVRN